jgi:hypothetical protein
MGLNTIFWLFVKYFIPLGILVYSIIKFNPFFIMLSVLWLLVTLVVSLINYSIKYNFARS